MSDLLFLASDYIERMANPVYGTAMNEDYALKFATLLSKEGFEGRLNEEIRTLTDRDALTSYGWLWLLGWAKSKDIQLNENLLVDLYEEWSSVLVRSEIVDLATRNVDYSLGPEVYFSIEEFPNSFLSRIMTLAIRRPEVEEKPPEAGDLRPVERLPATEDEPSTALAESTLVAFIQVGTPITVGAARVLLKHKWDGRKQLLQSFRAIYEALDPETREAWRKALNTPELE